MTVPVILNNFGLIENAGPNTLKAFLAEALPRAYGASLAVAFISESGLYQILKLLKLAAERRPVRVLTGLFQFVTEPAALATLLSVQRETNGAISARISGDPHFHWKAYLIHGRSSATAIVGSSNLTNDGLKTSGEISLAFTAPQTGHLFREIADAFEREWQTAKVLTEATIEAYKQERSKRSSHFIKGTPGLRAILGRGAAEAVPNANHRYWREGIRGFASRRTQAVLAEETSWDDKGYSWHSTSRKLYAKGDQMILFDWTSRQARMVDILAMTRTARPTPDGRHFVAHQTAKGTHHRKLSPRVWRQLKVAGLVLNRDEVLSNGRQLTESIFEKFIQILKLR